MNSNNFFIQLFIRLATKNPVFFKYIQVASLVCAAITGLPAWLDYFGITLPGPWQSVESTILAKVALVVAVLAQLPNENPPTSGTAATSDGGAAAAAKAIALLICLSFMSHAASAQSFKGFFGRMHKLSTTETVSDAPKVMKATLTATDSIFNAFRPITVPVAYGIPGNNVMAGVGVAYQHLDYNYASQLYAMKWEVALVGFGGVNMPEPNSLSAIATVALMGGIPIGNVPVLAGPAYFINAPKGQHIGAAVSLSINFNN